MPNKAVTQFDIRQLPAADPNKVLQHASFHNADGTPWTGLNHTFVPSVTGSAIGTVGKTTTAVEPAANTIVPIKFTNGNSASSPTIAFNGGTARAIQLGGVAVTGAKLTVAAGGVVLFFFDGTILHQLGTVA